MNLSDKVVLITGAGTGIGAALAAEYVRQGCRVALTGRRLGRLQAAADACGRPERTLVVAGDLSIASERQRVLAEVERGFGALDVLVNNMAAIYGGAFAETRVDELRRSVATNLLAPIEITLAALPALTRARGAVVNVISLAGLMAVPGQAVYAATKFGLRGFSEVLGRELAATGVRVLLAYPGSIDSEVNSAELRGQLHSRGVRVGALSAERAAERIVAAVRADRQGALIVGNLMERVIGRLAMQRSFVVDAFIRAISDNVLLFMTESTELVRRRAEAEPAIGDAAR